MRCIEGRERNSRHAARVNGSTVCGRVIDSVTVAHHLWSSMDCPPPGSGRTRMETGCSLAIMHQQGTMHEYAHKLTKCKHAQIHRALAQTENSEEFNIFHQHLTHFRFVMRLCATMMCGGPCEWLALSSQNTPGHHFTQNLLASISQRVQFTARSWTSNCCCLYA